MSDSSREPDALRANRKAAKLHPSTKTQYRHWAKRSGGQLAKAFGEKIRQPKQQRTGAAGGNGQTIGSFASSVPDSDYQQAGMHIPPSQSDHAEDEAQFHSLIPEGDDEAERECLDGGRRSLSCHADQGKGHTYRVKIVESMCEAGDDILPCLRLAPTCNIDVAAFAVPDFDAGSQTLDFNKFRICGIAYLTNSQAQKQAIAFCSCREQGAQAWRAVVLHHHEAHFDDVCGELESLSSKCVHACAILDMCLASNEGIEGDIRASMSTRPGEAGIMHACASPCFMCVCMMGM
jgi:hypothetical protein